MRIFVSCVSKEFGGYRDALRRHLASADADVKVQEDFVDGPGTLLEKLDDYIQRCQVIIHLIGKGCGVRAKPAEVRAILARHPRLPQALPELQSVLSLDDCPLTYTQWEVFLAIFHRVPRYIYLAGAESRREPSWLEDSQEAALQAAHVVRIRALGEDRRLLAFDDARDVALRFLCSYLVQVNSPTRTAGSTSEASMLLFRALRLPSSLNIQGMSRALDSSLASVVWARLGSGERGFLQRGMYNEGGRLLFDDLRRRCETEPSLRDNINTFVLEFETAIENRRRDSASDEEVMALQVSEVGRTYLLLAHATDRLD